MKNILLIKGNGVYGATRNYIDIFAEEFRKLGYHTFVVDVEDFDYREQYRWVLDHEKIYAVVDCQGAKNTLLDDVELPKSAACLHYFCDHPLYIWEGIRKIDAEEIIMNVDRENIHFLNKYYPQYRHAAFIPLGGKGTKVQLPFEQREIDILFTGSYWVPEAPAKPNEDGFAGQLRFLVQTELLRHTDRTIESVLEEILVLNQIDLDREEFIEILGELKDIETYVRQYHRDKLFHILLKAGIRVSVYGDGWEKFQCEGRENLTILKGGIETARRALGHTKIALNIMPGFKAGFQERIADAMLSGAVAVTDTSAYIEEEFSDGEDIVLYHLDKLEELPKKLEKLLRDSDYAKRIAEAGRKKALEKHTWGNRVAQMAELIEACHGEKGVKEPAAIQGRMREIDMPDRETAHVIREVGVKLSRQMNVLNEWYCCGYAEKEDAQRFLADLKDWEMQLKKKCGCSFFSGENMTVFVETFMELFERETDFDRNMKLLLMAADGMLLRIKEAIQSAELEKMLLGSMPVWNEELCNDMRVKHITKKYENHTEAAYQVWMNSIKNTHRLQSYPQSLQEKYRNIPVDMQYNQERDMFYVVYEGKPMYYPREYTPQQIYASYTFSCMEQDADSPHRYLDDTFDVEEGSCVIDAGTAEGNFALKIIERVKKIYLVECDEKWLSALEATFAPYQEKVVIVPKMLSDRVDEQYTTIDEIAGNEQIDFIKMDVEGAEADALLGAEKTLHNNRNIKLVIATYHAKGMEERVKERLRSLDFQVENTEGYLFFRNEKEPLWENELRHALVRAERNKPEHDME